MTDNVATNNRTLREEVWNLYIFRKLSGVRDIMDDFVREYNAARPHDLPTICRRSIPAPP
ncbi:MAG: transposase [Desulfovibrio sp.]|nr:transposase [Desulfovibrio sp.]